MDLSLYKDISTSRGYNYHYYFSSPSQSKPYLLFLHGFPSTSYDWTAQVSFFKHRGYGLIVPDMLGYGGTSKPTDVQQFRPSLICKDLIDILDAEHVNKAIVIGHDWGSKISTRLGNFYPDRFSGHAFLALSYFTPVTNFNIDHFLAIMRNVVGYETIGYWHFYSEPGADKLIQDNWDSFFSVFYPHDPILWKTTLGPTGALKSYILAGKKGPVPSYMTEEEKKIHSENVLKGSLASPLCWIKVMTSLVNADDDKSIPPERYTITSPAFFGAAKNDYVCVASLGKAAAEKHCPNLTVREFDADHWLIFSHADELNRELLEWINGSILKGKL